MASPDSIRSGRPYIDHLPSFGRAVETLDDARFTHLERMQGGGSASKELSKTVDRVAAGLRLIGDAFDDGDAVRLAGQLLAPANAARPTANILQEFAAISA